jgi:hypothetical protein
VKAGGEVKCRRRLSVHALLGDPQVDPNFMTGRANPETVLDILTKLSPHREGK